MVLVAIMGFVSTKTQFWNELIFDSREHGLKCSELLTAQEVNAILGRSGKLIAQIREVNPGLVTVNADTSTCSGKADLIIVYGSHNDRQKIERLIKGSQLEQLPIRWHNL